MKNIFLCLILSFSYSMGLAVNVIINNETDEEIIVPVKCPRNYPPCETDHEWYIAAKEIVECNIESIGKVINKIKAQNKEVIIEENTFYIKTKKAMF